MKITLKKDLWKTPIQQLSNITPHRNTLPIVQSLMIDPGNGVTLSATDLELGMKFLVEAEVEEPRPITIPAKKFHDILNSIDTEDVTIEPMSNDSIEIKSGNSKFKIVCLPPDEFPPLANIQSDAPLEISYDIFTKMLKQVIMCASTEETRHFLNGVFFQVADGNINLVGTDGKKLAITHTTTEWVGTMQAIVPIKTVQAILKLGGVNLRICLIENQLGFTDIDIGTSIISRTIEGAYPDYNAVIAPILKNGNRVVLKTSELINSLRRVATMAGTKVRSTKFAVEVDGFDAKLTMVSQNAEVGEASDWIVVEDHEIGDTKIEFAVNADYLLSILNAISTETLVLKHRDPSSPILIQEPGNEDVSWVLMPMRM
jgi:DNA polymerase-3 subunit beta